MTRKEVIEKLNELKIIFEDCMVDAEGDRDAAEALKNNQDSANALDIAIKALEQEPVIDKIRADVINIADGKQSIKVRSVLRIIAKCKAESEE